jgi:integrase
VLSRNLASVGDVVELVATLAADGKRRETIRKSVKYLAAVLDECELAGPNAARSKTIRLPYEEHVELNAPMASHVEAVYERLTSGYKLPLLLLDWSGARVSSIFEARVADYDRVNRRIRLRASTTKTRQALWIELPAELSTAIERTLADDLEAPIFGGNADALRTAIARACRDAGVPVFSPHDLRHRRISLLHKQGRSWAEIARFVGQRKLSLTADTYTHVLSDGRELDYGEALR